MTGCPHWIRVVWFACFEGLLVASAAVVAADEGLLGSGAGAGGWVALGVLVLCVFLAIVSFLRAARRARVNAMDLWLLVQRGVLRRMQMRHDNNNTTTTPSSTAPVIISGHSLSSQDDLGEQNPSFLLNMGMGMGLQSDAAALDDLDDCLECDEKTPPRAQHCLVCRECIFRFELHSSFLGVCVGLENWKFYFLFHFWSLAASIIVIVIHATRMSNGPFLNPAVLTLFAVAFFLSLVQFSLSLRSVLFHSWLVLFHGATVEDWRQRRLDAFKCSVKSNWTSVMGDGSVLLWLLPVQPSYSEGLLPEWYLSKSVQTSEPDALEKSTYAPSHDLSMDQSVEEPPPSHFIREAQKFRGGLFSYVYKSDQDEQ